MRAILRQTFAEPISGYWDGGPKQVFDWSIEGLPKADKDGQFIRVGSFAANFWFHVAYGKTIYQTLGNARRRLQAWARKRNRPPCTFQYIEEE